MCVTYNRITFATEMNELLNLNKKRVLLLPFLLLAFTCQAEEKGSKLFEYGVEYTGELQTNFEGDYNFLSHLRLDGTLNMTSRAKLTVSTISMARTCNHVAEDLQVFSNIEISEKIPLTIAVAGVEYELPTKHGSHTLFGGLRNTGEDYFASDLTAFFVSSSCGIHPTISANYSIGTFPCSSVCLHYAFDSRHWGAKATIYNGEGYYRFSGRENMFRFCPKSDGVFCMAQAEYKHEGGNYFLGGSLRNDSPVLWTYGERCVFANANCKLGVIASYSHCFDRLALCRNFAGIGAKLDVKDIQVGVFSDYADYGSMHEFATELNCRIPVTRYAYAMPALHYIHGSAYTGVIGMMRFGVSL